MTASKHGGKLVLIVLAGLLSAPSVTAEQRERTRANTSAPASKSEKPSSEAKDSSSIVTQGGAFERLLELLKQSQAKRDPRPFLDIEEKEDTIVFKHRTPFGLRTWTRKRSLLTPMEQKILRAHQARQAQAKQAQDEPDEQQEPSSEAAPAGVEAKQIDANDDQR